MKGNELNQNLEVSPRDTFNVLFCGWKRTLPWRGQKGASDGGGGVGGGEQRRPHLELKPRFPEPQGDAAQTSRQEAEATLNSAFAPPGPLAKGGETWVVGGGRVGGIVPRATVRA